MEQIRGSGLFKTAQNFESKKLFIHVNTTSGETNQDYNKPLQSTDFIIYNYELFKGQLLLQEAQPHAVMFKELNAEENSECSYTYFAFLVWSSDIDVLHCSFGVVLFSIGSLKSLKNQATS